jgi:single-strand DNA-binding protein
MNKVVLMGRLTKDPVVTYSGAENSLAIARYTLAVDRRVRRDGQQTADFISCKAFGRSAEFVERYLHKGTKVVVSGRIETGSYTNRDGNRVYTTEVVVEEHDFAESKSVSDSNRASYSNSYDAAPAPASDPGSADGFMNIPDGIEDELPFK